ncbi:hypothetical protein LER58_31065, partial [Pseudomonas aeruginosa]
MLSRLFVGLFALLLASAGQANAPRTFSEAKKIGWKLYARQSVEFYCGCRYSGNLKWTHLSRQISSGFKLNPLLLLQPN